MSWSAAARAEAPDHANDVLEEIRQEISAADDDPKEARKRRDLVLKAAASFPRDAAHLQVRVGRPRQREQPRQRRGRRHGARPPRPCGVGPRRRRGRGPGRDRRRRAPARHGHRARDLPERAQPADQARDPYPLQRAQHGRRGPQRRSRRRAHAQGRGWPVDPEPRQGRLGRVAPRGTHAAADRRRQAPARAPRARDPPRQGRDQARLHAGADLVQRRGAGAGADHRGQGAGRVAAAVFRHGGQQHQRADSPRTPRACQARSSCPTA